MIFGYIWLVGMLVGGLVMAGPDSNARIVGAIGFLVFLVLAIVSAGFASLPSLIGLFS